MNFMNRNNNFGTGLILGSMIGVGISMMNTDNLKKIKKNVVKTARRMKVNKMINNITDNINDMF